MASARKCDCCGGLYEAYNFKGDRYNISGIIPINVDSKGECCRNTFVDLCPVCIKPIHNILEKVKENSK